MPDPPTIPKNTLIAWMRFIRTNFLDRLVNDSEYLPEIFRSMGLDAGGSPIFSSSDQSRLTSIDAYINKNEEDATIEDFVSAVLDVQAIFNAISDFVGAGSGGPYADDHIATAIIEFAMLDALRIRYPVAHRIWSLLDVLDNLSQTEGGIVRFSDTIISFVKEFFASHDNDTETAGRRLSDVYFLVASGALSFIPFFKQIVRAEYGFDAPDSSPTPNADRISKRTLTVSISGKTKNPVGDEVEGTQYFSFDFIPKDTSGAAFQIGVEGDAKISVPVGNGWKAEMEITSGSIFLRMGSRAGVYGNATDGSVTLSLKRDLASETQNKQVIGNMKGSRLELGGVEIKAKASAENFEGKLEIKDCALVVMQGDNFLTQVMPKDGIRAEFGLGIGYSFQRGLFIDGGSGIMVSLPMHVHLGPVDLQSVIIALKPNKPDAPDGIQLETSVGFMADLGIMKASVQRIGLTYEVSKGKFHLGFKPPNGVGLVVDTGGFKGGGFLSFDPDKGEYAGAIELTFMEVISLKAVGIINTKMPDGSSGFAFLILITAEFTPLQLGFGFTLIGVGGLFALNRSADLEVLRTGVRTGALESVLFPSDVVANMNRIISDLSAIFPITKGRTIILPMGKLGWGTPTLISLELGIMIDTGFAGFAILGIIQAKLPDKDFGVLVLQVNFLGVFDFGKGLISFDGSLYESRLLIYTLTGDMALRVGWGESSIFILTCGGFHPSFHEIPADLTNLTRITIGILSGNNPRLVAQKYFAVTSNTVQAGAKLEVYAEVGEVSIYGFMGYDLLIQFNPFHFIADISAGLSLRVGGNEIAGIHLDLELSGPIPWHAIGTGSIKIIFFKISVHFDVTWGDDKPETPLPPALVFEATRQALSDDRNWKANIPANSNMSVTLKDNNLQNDSIIIHPFGNLTVSQKVVPLRFKIDKFGNQTPGDGDYFEVLYPAAGTSVPVTEEFAIANFLNLSDSDKLALPSFEQKESGLLINSSTAPVTGSSIDKTVIYKLEYLPRENPLERRIFKRTMLAAQFNQTSQDNAIHRSAYAVSKKVNINAPPAVVKNDPVFKVVTTEDLSVHQGMEAATMSGAVQLRNEAIRKDPALATKLQVMADYELVG
jgi:hypothetical protein